MRDLRTLTRAAFALVACVATFGCSDSTSPNKDNSGGNQGGNNGPTTGQLSIWTDYDNAITVSVDGGAVGSTTTHFTTDPACAQAGTITLTLQPGSHAITGSSGAQSWNGSATVTAGQCTMYKLAAPAAATTGQLSLWTDYTNPIAVTVDGNSIGSTSAHFSTAPACGATGTLTVTLPAGSHAVAGTSGSDKWNITASVAAGQCKLYQLAAPAAPPPPTNGQLSFWTDYQSPISINVDGASAGTTNTYFTSAPACGQSGTVTVSLAPGSHSFTAASGSNTWSGTVSIASGQCTLYKLAAPAAPTGQLSIWTDYSTQIAVRVDGNAVGNTTTYFSSGTPACGQSGTITVTLPAGAHTVSGISGQYSWNGSVSVAAGQCTLYKLSAPSGATNGQLSIWTDYSNQIAVGIDGSSVGTLTTYFPNGAPSCGQAGTITVTLPAGSHIVAGASGSYTWNGSVNVVAGQCTLYKLNKPAAPSTGQLSIWTNYSTQISVGVDGYSAGTLTSYFPNGTPSCGQAGTITVTVAAGTHTVSGVSGQYTWNGTANVSPGGCTLYELVAP
jgi:hypothetical protein